MTQEKMEELARAAAHSALLASSDKHSFDFRTQFVDEFIELYNHAMKKLYEKQQQAQVEANRYAPKTSDDYINGGRSL